LAIRITPSTIIKAVIGLFGLALLAVAGLWSFQNWRLIARSVTVAGNFVSNERQTDENRSELYHTVFHFRTLDGREITTSGKIGSTSPSDFKPGEAIDVLYNDADPKQAQIESFSELWLGTAVIGIIGVSFLMISVALFLLGLRSRQN
jgi:hypothetical protein